MPNRPTPEPRPASKRLNPNRFEGQEDLDYATDGQDASEPLTDGNPVKAGGDTGFDRIVGPEEAGLGGGLDQAEEAQLGITDEELAELAKSGRKPKR
jgi:hypothetical protein